MAVIEGGGVTAAKGFRAAGVYAGVKSSNPEKRDVALRFVGHAYVVNAGRPAAFDALRACDEPLPLRLRGEVDVHRQRDGRLMVVIRRNGEGEVAEREYHAAHRSAVGVAVRLRQLHRADAAAVEKLVYTHAVIRCEAVVFEKLTRFVRAFESSHGCPSG